MAYIYKNTITLSNYNNHIYSYPSNSMLDNKAPPILEKVLIEILNVANCSISISCIASLTKLRQGDHHMLLLKAHVFLISLLLTIKHGFERKTTSRPPCLAF